MSLTRFAPLALAALVLAGCGSTPENYVEPEQPAPAAAPDDVSMSELMNRNMRTSELGVGLLKDPAKTVGYAPGSTGAGERMLDGSLIVDHVARQDADNHFGATVSVFNNRDDAPLSFEWRIAFFNVKGAEVPSLNPGWKKRTLDANRWGSVSNSATVRGAVTFKLEARAPQAAPAPAP